MRPLVRMRSSMNRAHLHRLALALAILAVLAGSVWISGEPGEFERGYIERMK